MTAQEQGLQRVGEAMAREIPKQMTHVTIIYPKPGMLPTDVLSTAQIAFVTPLVGCPVANMLRARRAAELFIQKCDEQLAATGRN